MARIDISIPEGEYTTIDVDAFPIQGKNGKIKRPPTLRIHSDGVGRLVVEFDNKRVLDVTDWNFNRGMTNDL